MLVTISETKKMKDKVHAVLNNYSTMYGACHVWSAPIKEAKYWNMFVRKVSKDRAMMYRRLI
jgi:hypothetical protein